MPTTHGVPGSTVPDQTAAYQYPPPAARPRLRRSDSERMLLGVCGGIAEYTDVDPTLVRLAMIGTLFWGGLGVLLYLIAAIVLPRAATGWPDPGRAPQGTAGHRRAPPASAAWQDRTPATGHRPCGPEDDCDGLRGGSDRPQPSRPGA